MELMEQLPESAFVNFGNEVLVPEEKLPRELREVLQILEQPLVVGTDFSGVRLLVLVHKLRLAPLLIVDDLREYHTVSAYEVQIIVIAQSHISEKVDGYQPLHQLLPLRKGNLHKLNRLLLRSQVGRKRGALALLQLLLLLLDPPAYLCKLSLQLLQLFIGLLARVIGRVLEEVLLLKLFEGQPLLRVLGRPSSGRVRLWNRRMIELQAFVRLFPEGRVPYWLRRKATVALSRLKLGRIEEPWDGRSVCSSERAGLVVRGRIAITCILCIAQTNSALRFENFSGAARSNGLFRNIM